MPEAELREKPCVKVEDWVSQLKERGYVVLQPDQMPDGPEAALEKIGSLIPQYDGKITHEVTFKAGFGNLPYSQSQNGIGAHTEAPAMTPPPAYLALHCHKQAQCGGGHTAIMDMMAVIETMLDDEMRQRIGVETADFKAAPVPGCDKIKTVRARIVELHGSGCIIRYSDNLFRYGNVNPSEDEFSNKLTTGFFAKIANVVDEAFSRDAIQILIPEGCLFIWNNHKFIHGRAQYQDSSRHLTRYWVAEK